MRPPIRFRFLLALWLLPGFTAAGQPADPNQPVRFAVIGDFGIERTDIAIGRVAALVAGWEPDFVTTVGDNNYPHGEARTIDRHVGQYYGAFIHPYRGRYGPGAEQNRFFPALGNHDWESLTCDEAGCRGPHFDYFELPGNERYYDVVWGPVHLFVVDSDSLEPDGVGSSSVQGAWLRDGLAASEACWQVVAFHHAPYMSGDVNGPSAWMRWPFAAWGADVVLSGHEHFYERILRDGMLYLVNGSGGAHLYPKGTPDPGSVVHYNERWGALRVDASCGSITYTFVNDLGEEIDAYTVAKPSGLAFGPLDVRQEDVEVQVAWTTRDEINIVGIALERRIGEGAYETVAERTPGGGFRVEQAYGALFPNLPAGRHTYRVRWTGLDGRTGVSEPTTIDVVASGLAVREFDAAQLRYDTIRLDWETDDETLLESIELEEVVGPDSARVLAAFTPQGRSTAGLPGQYTREIAGLEEGTYTYRVRWRGRDGRTGLSEPLAVEVVRSSVQLAAAQARQQFDVLEVRWSTASEFLLQDFTVERAAADSPFAAVETFPARGEPAAYAHAAEGLPPGSYPLRLRWRGTDEWGGVLPLEDVRMRSQLRLDTVTVRQDGEDAVLAWTTEGEYGVRAFAVARGAGGGGAFTASDTVEAEGASREGRSYVVRFERPGFGLHRIRVTWIGVDGETGPLPEQDLVLESSVRLAAYETEFTDSRVVLTWRAGAETYLDGYAIERETGADVYEEIAFVPAGQTELATPGDTLHTYRYAIERLDNGRYAYRVRWKGLDGRSGLSGAETVEVAHALALEPAYPNPFASQTRIGYSLTHAAPVRLEVIDMMGRRVEVIDHGERPAGPHEVVVSGAGLAAGVYQYRFFVDGQFVGQRAFVVGR